MSGFTSPSTDIIEKLRSDIENTRTESLRHQALAFCQCLSERRGDTGGASAGDGGGAGTLLPAQADEDRGEPWINMDPPDAVSCRERYILTGEHERNVACDITDHRWFDEVPFDRENEAVFPTAGVLHYPTREAVGDPIRDMIEHFPEGLLVFGFVNEKGMPSGSRQVEATDNATGLTSSMEDVEKEAPAFSDLVAKVAERRRLELSGPGRGFNPMPKACTGRRETDTSSHTSGSPSG